MTASLVDVIRRSPNAESKAQIEAGAEVNCANSSGTTPLHAAAFKADETTAEATSPTAATKRPW